MRIHYLFALFGTAVLAPAALPGAQDGAGASVIRIELAAGQRHRSQIIAKGACFAMSSRNPKQNGSAAWLAADEFGQVLRILRLGNEAKGVVPAQDPTLLEAIAAVEADWLTLRAAARQIISNDLHSVAIAQVIRLNDALLEKSNAIVLRLQALDGRNEAEKTALLRTVNLAARQRMLSQLTAKAYCFARLDVDANAMRLALATATENFETALSDLKWGNPEKGIVTPPDKRIYSQLDKVRNTWEAYRAPLDRLIRDHAPLPDDLALVEQLNTPLLRTVDELVRLYLPDERG